MMLREYGDYFVQSVTRKLEGKNANRSFVCGAKITVSSYRQKTEQYAQKNERNSLKSQLRSKATPSSSSAPESCAAS